MKDPNAPKKNMTALKFYQSAKANRSDVKAANPDAKYDDVNKILSTNFKALSPVERASWDEKAVADKARYQREMSVYSSALMASNSNKRKASGGDSAKPKSKRARKYCSHEGCTTQARKGGVCIKHGAEVKTCNQEGCTTQARKGGVCIKHRAEVKQYHKTCSHEGCTTLAVSGYEGKCIRHGTEVDGRCREDHMADAESKLATITPLHSDPETKRILAVYQGGYERLSNGMEGKMAEEVAQEVAKELSICPTRKPYPMKKPTKMTRFRPTVTIRHEDCKMTPEEHSRSYLSKDEMRRFRLEVVAIHALSRRLSNTPPTCCLHMTEHDCVIGLEVHPALRGLEHYLCPARARNKTITRKALLGHQSSLKTDHTKTREEKLQSLASMSVELSHHSKQVAEEAAKLDSLQVRGGPRTLPLHHPSKK